MMPGFDLKNHIKEGTPQKLEEFFKSTKQPISESDLSMQLLAAYQNRKSEFCGFLPVLLKRGANINTLENENYKKTILMLACLSGHVDIVAKLLELGADVTLKDYQNKNALFYCIQGKDETVGAYLLNSILDRYPDLINAEASNRKTVLLYAVEKVNREAVKVILHRQANVNQCLDDSQETALHLAVKKHKKKGDNSAILAIIDMLLEKKINASARTKTGKSVLDVCQDEEWKRTIQERINGAKDEEKRRLVKVPTQESGRDMIKTYNNVIKSSLKKKNQVAMRINDRSDEISLQREAAAAFEQHIAEKQRKYEEQKRREERKRQQQQSQKSEQLTRSMNWIVPPPVLKHYLEEEIKIFTEQIERENNSNKEDFDELIGLISKSLQAALGVQVTVYGSFATRLCLKESDIDVVVIPAEGDTSQPVDLLEKIDNIIKTLDFVSETKFIRTAFIPVIKVSCNEHYKSKRIDITLQDGNHNGLNCVNIIRHYMEQYLELRPLAFVLKTFIYSSNLYDTYQGGLSSYGLILMIVAFLQREYMYKQPDQRLLVSELLIKFLRFFGYEFDYVKKYICVEGPSTTQNFIVPEAMITQDVTPKLVLLDPLNIKNNVGRSTHQIKLVQMAFCFAYTCIQTNYSCRQPDCQYRARINAVKLPKELGEAAIPRPCCILKRMFECAKNIM